MKFWELTSAFRTEHENLKTVFAKDCWKKYSIAYENLDSIVANQDRDILDEIIPLQLAKEVCALSKLKFYLYYQAMPHHLYTGERAHHEDYEMLNALDILLRFGGNFIEEALEYGMAYVSPKEIGADIEVLDVFKVAQMGLLAFLRTTNGPLKNGERLVSLDEQRSWIVQEEPFILLNPYAAQLKRTQQIQQGIRQYLISPLKGSGKPKETELLKIDRR